MKKLLWISAMALAAVACLTACDDSSSGSSNSIPEYKTAANLPDSCEMEVAKVDTAYFACFENKWIEVTDSATVEQFKEGLDEDKIKEKLEELENLLKPSAPAKPKSSASKEEDLESSDDSEEPESSSSEECTGRRCKTGKSSSSRSSGGNSGGGGSGHGGGGSGSGGGDDSSSSGDVIIIASSSSLNRDEHYSVIDEYVTWDEEGKTATIITTGTGTSLLTKLSKNQFENLKIESATDVKSMNALLKKMGADLSVNMDYVVSIFTATDAMDSSMYMMTIPNVNVGSVIKTFIVPRGKCGDKSYYKLTQFCSSGTVYSLCDGKTYDPTNVFCDARGTGTLYKYVTIGTQTWMAENLNYATASGSYCFNDQPDKCATDGRLYTWAATSGVCPSGWTMPTQSDWQDLMDNSGYGKNTTSYRKDGSNETGFSSVDAGHRAPDGTYGSYTRYWSSTKASSSGYYYYLHLGKNTDMGLGSSNGLPEYAYPVRCIKE